MQRKGLNYASLFLRVDLEDALLRNRSRAADSFVSEEVKYSLLYHILMLFTVHTVVLDASLLSSVDDSKSL